MNAIIDNDIIFKGACYCLLQEIVTAVKAKPDDCGVLGAARFVVKHKIEGAKLSKDTKLVLQSLQTFVSVAVILEPSETEQAFAARLEVQAMRLGLGLDPGESQLCAIAIERSASLFRTGDKRAIVALQELLINEPGMLKLCGKVMCLEQVIVLLIALIKFGVVRDAICLEPNVDKALQICFSCVSGGGSESSATAGLNSYINDLRSTAEKVLVT